MHVMNVLKYIIWYFCYGKCITNSVINYQGATASGEFKLAVKLRHGYGQTSHLFVFKHQNMWIHIIKIILKKFGKTEKEKQNI